MYFNEFVKKLCPIQKLDKVTCSYPFNQGENGKQTLDIDLRLILIKGKMLHTH